MRGCIWMCLQNVDAASGGKRKVVGVNFRKGEGRCLCYTDIGKAVNSSAYDCAFRVAD